MKSIVMYPNKPLEVEEGGITVLETSSRSFYGQFTLLARDKKDNLKCFFDDDEVAVSSGIEWLGDPVMNGIPISLKSKMQKLVITQIGDGLQKKLFEINNELKSYVLDECFRYDVPLTVSSDWSVEKLVKYTEISLNSQVINNPYGIIETILKLSFEVVRNKILVLYNIFDYLDLSQFQQLVSEVKKLGISVLLINFSESNNSGRFENVRYYFVDEDFVVF